MRNCDLHDPMKLALSRFKSPDAPAFEDAWVGIEPTFQTRRAVKKWMRMSATPEGEDAYFDDPYMLKTQRKVAGAIVSKYRKDRRAGKRRSVFERVQLERDQDPWEVTRQNLQFHWKEGHLEPFEARFGLDPETFEFSIKPIPLLWFYDPRFVKWLDAYVWKVPQRHGLSCAIAHGGAQFSVSAKTFMTGSLLADDIAYKTSHPELACWIMDWPNPDDRTFRATSRRLSAFRTVIDQYWEGRFHPRALGTLTSENAYFDRGFGPALRSDASAMDPLRGPVGDQRDVFQTNFAFGRTVRLHAQSVDPGYWQSAHPDDDGFRPDQVMRYGEGNLNRLQIAGELHVKSDKVLDAERVPELDAPLEPRSLTIEASWENRAQMCRTSARDFVEALLLDIHHAQYLQRHPHVRIAPSLAQDQLLGGAEDSLRRHGANAVLDRLHEEARAHNLEQSSGRIHSDRIEPEVLFWEAWNVLPIAEKRHIAFEAIGGFIERVEQAASVDPRPAVADPMAWHRHRIHPLLWSALTGVQGGCKAVLDERDKWMADKRKYLARRPVWSQLDESRPPWEAVHDR